MKTLTTFALLCCLATPCLAPVTFSGKSTLAGKVTLNAPVGPYTPNAVDFDGANDYMTRGADLTGNADSKVGTVSFWYKENEDDSAVNIIYSSGNGAAAGLYIYRFSGSKIYIDGYNSAGTRQLIMVTDGASPFNVAAGWRHFMASWNLLTGATHQFVDNVDQLGALTAVNDTIDYTQPNHSIGGYASGGSKITACAADIYINLAEYVDLSVAGNRAKFYSASALVDLGSNGSLPTGTSPIIFMKGNAAGFNVNSGTGGNFTTTGTLTTCSDKP